ncbi:MAG TPA: UDP-glucuronic acid decarboxylase family protein [Cellulomonadaceae bacterium]|jgi:dTDP-glucose 4,6-dehydratase|nr:UDP-glucuronic acid decarboxylase family protein [Cellulomonadaceae bacterium]
MARAVVTGGAGFIGSHLCTALRARGEEVVAVDNLSTGERDNVTHLLGDPGFAFLEQDVIDGLAVDGPVDSVLHFASAASVPEYLARPLETLRVGAEGTRHALELAHAHGARFLLASTSEIYGDPLVHPQPENYWGNVNPVGPRSVYDEAKRYGEALTMAYHRTHGVDTKIVRIFNCFGPGLLPGDGRVVSNFLVQAMAGEPLTVYGDGTQTRSFCFIDDEVRGILALLDSRWNGPMNIGNPDEHTVLELAKLVLDVTASSSPIAFAELPDDDPTRRRPDISLARSELGWSPEIELRDGLARTYAWYRERAGG